MCQTQNKVLKKISIAKVYKIFDCQFQQKSWNKSISCIWHILLKTSSNLYQWQINHRGGPMANSSFILPPNAHRNLLSFWPIIVFSVNSKHGFSNFRINWFGSDFKKQSLLCTEMISLFFTSIKNASKSLPWANDESAAWKQRKLQL